MGPPIVPWSAQGCKYLWLFTFCSLCSIAQHSPKPSRNPTSRPPWADDDINDYNDVTLDAYEAQFFGWEPGLLGGTPFAPRLPMLPAAPSMDDMILGDLHEAFYDVRLQTLTIQSDLVWDDDDAMPRLLESPSVGDPFDDSSEFLDSRAAVKSHIVDTRFGIELVVYDIFSNLLDEDEWSDVHIAFLDSMPPCMHVRVSPVARPAASPLLTTWTLRC